MLKDREWTLPLPEQQKKLFWLAVAVIGIVAVYLRFNGLIEQGLVYENQIFGSEHAYSSVVLTSCIGLTTLILIYAVLRQLSDNIWLALTGAAYAAVSAHEVYYCRLGLIEYAYGFIILLAFYFAIPALQNLLDTTLSRFEGIIRGLPFMGLWAWGMIQDTYPYSLSDHFDQSYFLQVFSITEGGLFTFFLISGFIFLGWVFFIRKSFDLMFLFGTFLLFLLKPVPPLLTQRFFPFFIIIASIGFQEVLMLFNLRLWPKYTNLKYFVTTIILCLLLFPPLTHSYSLTQESFGYHSALQWLKNKGIDTLRQYQWYPSLPDTISSFEVGGFDLCDKAYQDFIEYQKFFPQKYILLAERGSLQCWEKGSVKLDDLAGKPFVSFPNSFEITIFHLLDQGYTIEKSKNIIAHKDENNMDRILIYPLPKTLPVKERRSNKPNR